MATTLRLPDLEGASLGRYQLLGRIGEGRVGAVYRAIDSIMSQALAVKVLDPAALGPYEAWKQVERDLEAVSTLGHPHIIELYEHGAAEGFRYVAMALGTGGTLNALSQRGPLDATQVVTLLIALADALNGAHERGIVHRDLKPGNVLFDEWGKPLVSDFGIARNSYGLPGTPGYIAPEVAMGRSGDRRANVYGLAVLAFEMLTGTRLYPESSDVQMIMSTVHAPVPEASSRNPQLAREVDLVLARGLAKSPEDRQRTTIEFVEELAQASNAAAAAGAARPGATLGAGNPSAWLLKKDEFDRSVAKFMEVLNLSLSAAVMVDETSFIVGWNERAAQTFGWSQEEIVGRSLVTTLIPPAFREAHERGLRHYLNTGEGPVLGQVLKLSALRRDGREIPIELSISEAARLGPSARILAFLRDLAPEENARQLSDAQTAVLEIADRVSSLEAAGPAILEALAQHLGWSCAALWTPQGDCMRCAHFWAPHDIHYFELEAASFNVCYGLGEGLPGRVWESGEVTWVTDVLNEDDPRTLPAARGQLRSAVAMPVARTGEVKAILEFFSTDARRPDDETTDRLYDIGGRIGRRFRG